VTNPLNTLTGRMVSVTIVAVMVAYAIAFAIYTNERGSALRRAAETNVAERVAFTAERLRDIPTERRRHRGLLPRFLDAVQRVG
jgi:hypothetical protein